MWSPLNYFLCSGPPIKSWVQSVLPIFDQVIGGYPNISAKFDSKGKVKEVSYKNGFWKWSRFGNGEHDGWLYQENPEDLSNKKVTYIYDDFSTVIYGTFENKILIEGYASKIIAFRCHQVREHLYSMYGMMSNFWGYFKGQIISEWLLDVFIWTKKRTKIFLYFCPSI